MEINHKFHFNKNTTPGRNKMEFLIAHHTGGKNSVNTLAGLTTRKVSCHYLISQDGTVYQFVDEDKIAWHCGYSKRKGLKNLNDRAIGIEVESMGHNYSDIQKKVFKKLAGEIMERHNIPLKNFLRHKDISGYRGKRDIGPNFYAPYTWEGYKHINFESEKIKLIKEIMRLNSELYSISSSEETQDRLHDMNEYFRSVGF